ncbi:hypothetical protein HG531_012476 [Fusarium graminearum]|nr:hypothetical protein HG531_012476 [Fusarium graminearum]
MLITSRLFPGGDESKEIASGAELDMGSHAAFFLGSSLFTGADGEVMIMSGSFDVVSAGWGELAKGSDDSMGLAAVFNIAFDVGFDGERRTAAGELANGSESSVIVCSIGFADVAFEGLI